MVLGGFPNSRGWVLFSSRSPSTYSLQELPHSSMGMHFGGTQRPACESNDRVIEYELFSSPLNIFSILQQAYILLYPENNILSICFTSDFEDVIIDCIPK